jgi:hypothetical protein
VLHLPLFAPFENPLVQIAGIVAAFRVMAWAWNGIQDDRARQLGEAGAADVARARDEALRR